MSRPSTRPRRHTCHLPGCARVCPPEHLLCRTHWFLLPTKLQCRVNDSAWQRGKQIDATWAAWWRAKTNAMAWVLRHTGWQDEATIVKFEVRGEMMATLLEGTEI